MNLSDLINILRSSTKRVKKPIAIYEGYIKSNEIEFMQVRYYDNPNADLVIDYIANETNFLN